MPEKLRRLTVLRNLIVDLAMGTAAFSAGLVMAGLVVEKTCLLIGIIGLSVAMIGTAAGILVNWRLVHRTPPRSESDDRPNSNNHCTPTG